MEALIREKMKSSLSDSDLIAMTEGKCNVYEYKDILQFDNIDQMLQPFGCCIILYETAERFGHYTAVLKQGNTIEFFDSLALKPDWQLLFVDKKKRKHLGEEKPHLTYLMLDSPYKLIYNKWKFQKFDKNVSTCGRWVALRICLNYIPLKKFQQLFKNQPKSPDYYVTAMTLALI
jgi:hypothetical protein